MAWVPGFWRCDRCGTTETPTDERTPLQPPDWGHVRIWTKRGAEPDDVVLCSSCTGGLVEAMKLYVGDGYGG